MASSTYTKTDLVWMLQLRASILYKRGNREAADEFEKLVNYLQNRTLEDLIQTSQLENGLEKIIPRVHRWMVRL
jgi:hypothetical protein